MSQILRLTLLLILVTPFAVNAQERCGTTKYEKMRNSQLKSRETTQQFEQWMKERISQNQLKTFQTGKMQSATYVIPVVVHVIHNGEPVGTGTNISDAQIQSQIDVLNADYNRLNADASNTPAEFQPVAGSINIQFVLARQDPNGLPANLNGNSYGIRRVKGTKTSWTLVDNSIFKSLSYWPAENYLNIWVINLVDPGSLIGYAQLPVSNQLSGLETASTDRLTDGVVINYKDFGSGASFNLDAKFNKGRTTTHEVGHFLGLRHIWSEDVAGCGPPGDYVDDTPPQTASTNSCPTSPLTSCSPFHKMYQNYMDYTDDACMNLFTQGQVARMVVILGNSPRRLSLLTSPGASDPVPVSNDLALSAVVSPATSTCVNPVVPKIKVTNTGSNQITSATIQLTVNGVSSSASLSSSLSQYQSSTVSFSAVTLPAGSTSTLIFQVTLVNGTTDGNSNNDTQQIDTTIPASISLPILEPFNSVPGGWTISNPDGSITWALVGAADGSPSNKAMYMDLFDYQNEGAIDGLITPWFAIASPATSQMKFDVAYSYVTGQPADNLKVYALPGCDPDLAHGLVLYDKSGSQLATAATQNAFVPTTGSQWRKSEVISLSTLPPGSYQISFVATNAYGNNLFVDNVVVTDNVVNDLAIDGIVSPGLVHCQPTPALNISIKNFSTSPVTSFQVTSSVNGGQTVTQSFSNIQLDIGSQKIFSLNPVTLRAGANQITVAVINPNGLPDSFPTNNSITFTTYLDQTSEPAPLRKTFDVTGEAPWLAATPSNGTLWQNALTNKGQSIYFPSYNDAKTGEQSWLASPVIDLSAFTTNSFFFDVSYAMRGSADERLQLLASSDCGLTYPLVLFDRPGSQFSNGSSVNPWTPAANSDWQRMYINLDSLSGKPNVRLAFVVTNGQGNNLYLDNLEVFAGDDPQPPVTSLPYQLYYSNKVTTSDVALTFTLPTRKNVRLQIFSIMGQVVADNVLEDVLNQTYYFDLSGQASGLYLFRLQIDDSVSTTKVFIGH